MLKRFKTHKHIDIFSGKCKMISEFPTIHLRHLHLMKNSSNRRLKPEWIKHYEEIKQCIVVFSSKRAIYTQFTKIQVKEHNLLQKLLNNNSHRYKYENTLQ